MPKSRQYLYSVFAVCSVSGICYLLSPLMGYRVVALVLLLIVSVIAMFFEIYPVLASAALSALIWDFFFIPPKFTFYITGTEDLLMLFAFFFIAMISGVLNYKIRQWERIARKREEKRNTLKLYDSLLNSLSHELRTPIAAIIAATDNLRAEKESLSENDKDELLSEISKASLRLNGQVENLLNMSRIDSAAVKPTRDWCDMKELINDVKKQLADYTSEHVVLTDCPDAMPLVKIDYGLTSQSLYNLVYNAALYTPPGSNIQVKTGYKQGQLFLVVEDSGSGFPEAEIEMVFEKFYRLKNSATGGTGLGLSIVKGFTEAHGGTIELRNVKTGGARFTITIPAESTK